MTHRSTFVHFLPWQFTMNGLTPFKSSFWCSRPPNSIRAFTNERGTFKWVSNLTDKKFNKDKIEKKNQFDKLFQIK